LLSNFSFRCQGAACLAAAASLCCVALLIRAAAPSEATTYVENGLFFSARTYSLLLPLIAFGAALTEASPSSFAFDLVAFSLTLCVTVNGADSFLRSRDDILTLLVRHPVGTIAMCVAIGIALLLPARISRWYLPLAAMIVGIAFGVALQLESPGDDYTGWFSWSGALGGTVIVLASAAVWAALKHEFRGMWFGIASRVLGSWLIATSLMLAGLAFVSPKPRLDRSPVMPKAIRDIDGSRQPRATGAVAQ
jgi:hypothetical protein